MKTVSSEPAYPIPAQDIASWDGASERVHLERGLTKRELFAAMAMQGILAANNEPVPNLTDADFEPCKHGRYVKSGAIWVVAASDTPLSLRLRMIKTGPQRRAECAVACADDLIAALNAEKPDAPAQS